jgi:UDP-glucose 4-epimerase
MAVHRLIQSALSGLPFEQFGDGSQVRDFTFVADVVSANLAAAVSDVPGGIVANVAGGTLCSLTELSAMVSQIAGAPVTSQRHERAHGDVRCTSGAIDLARQAFGWQPAVLLSEGLARQVEWHRSMDRSTADGDRPSRR